MCLWTNCSASSTSVFTQEPLNQTTSHSTLTAEDYQTHAQVRINKDLKIQLEQQCQIRLEAERMSQELRSRLNEVQEHAALRLSLKSAINMDLSSKLEEAHKQLQRASSQRSTEAPSDKASTPTDEFQNGAGGACFQHSVQ